MSCRVRQIPAQSRLCQPYAVSFRASCLTSLSLENIHCNTEIILYRLLGCWWEERTWKDQYVYVCTQLSPILCDPTDSSPPGSSVQGFSRQEYWSGLLSPIPGDLPAPGTEPQSPVSSVLADGFFFFFTTKLPHQSLNKCEVTSVDGESGRLVSCPEKYLR